MKNKKATLTVQQIIMALLMLIAVGTAIYISAGKIKDLFKIAPQTQFDEVCCCKEKLCEKLYRKDCQTKKEYSIQDDNKCVEV